MQMENEARAYLHDARISSRKVKIVIDTIRGKKAEERGCKGSPEAS